MANQQNPNNESANTDDGSQDFDWLDEVTAPGTGDWPDVDAWMASIGTAGDEPVTPYVPPALPTTPSGGGWHLPPITDPVEWVENNVTPTGPDLTPLPRSAQSPISGRRPAVTDETNEDLPPFMRRRHPGTPAHSVRREQQPQRRTGANRTGHTVSRQPTDAGVHFVDEGQDEDDRNVAHLNPPRADTFRPTGRDYGAQAAGTPPTEPHEKVVVNRGCFPWRAILAVLLFLVALGGIIYAATVVLPPILNPIFYPATATPVTAAQQQVVAPQVQPTVLSDQQIQATVQVAVMWTVTASAPTPMGITQAQQTAGFNQPAPIYTPAAPQVVQPQAAMPAAVNTCVLVAGVEKVDLYETTTSNTPWGSIYNLSVVSGTTIIKVVDQNGDWLSLRVENLATWGSNAKGEPVIIGYGDYTGWAMPSQGLICNLGRQQQSGANPTPSF